VVHGALDNLIRPALGRKLYNAATVPKLFVLVEGGSHFSTNTVGAVQYSAALTKLFHIKPPSEAATTQDEAPVTVSPTSTSTPSAAGHT